MVKLLAWLLEHYSRREPFVPCFLLSGMKALSDLLFASFGRDAAAVTPRGPRQRRVRVNVNAFRMMQLGTWVLSTVCGSMGVFSLWFTFINAALISYTFAFLGIACALQVANHFFLAEPRR
jgi:hypothetical protein